MGIVTVSRSLKQDAQNGLGGDQSYAVQLPLSAEHDLRTRHGKAYAASAMWLIGFMDCSHSASGQRHRRYCLEADTILEIGPSQYYLATISKYGQPSFLNGRL